jgi:hypothetical protein
MRRVDLLDELLRVDSRRGVPKSRRFADVGEKLWF